MPRLRLVPFIALFLVVAACDAAPDPPTTATPYPTPVPARWSQAAEETWEDSVRATLWVQNETVQPGGLLYARVEVENLTGEDVPYTLNWENDPPVYLSIRTPLGFAVQLSHPDEPERERLHRGAFETLGPGERVERTVLWDVAIPGVFAGERYTVPVPNGTYQVEAVFYPERQALGLPDRPLLLVSHDVQVAGSRDVLHPYRAEEIVRALPEIQEWLALHHGEAVTKEENGAYFQMNDEGEWREVDRELYESARGRDVGGPARSLTEAGWWMGFRMGFGPSPRQVMVLLDAETGEVLSVEYDH